MKKFTLFLLTILISYSAWGANITQGTGIHLKPNSNWKQANARFVAYFYGDGNCLIEMTDTDNDGIYSCVQPNNKNYTNVIFVRMDPSKTISWDAKWNQTGDLTYDGKNNLFTINSWDGQTTGWSYYRGKANLYFAQPEDWTKDKVNFMLGHNTYSKGFLMQKISNTRIYYFTNLSLWSDYTQWAIFDENTEWGGEGNNIDHRAQYSSQETTTVEGSLNPNNLLQNGSCLALNSYTDLNHDQTINVTTDGSASTTGGSITASTYYLSGVSTASKTSGSTSDATTTISAAYTATVTLTATAKTGYTFKGWYDGTTQKSTSTTYSYMAEKATKIITAKFEITKCTITTKVNNAKWGTVSGGGTYNYGATDTLTATPNDGYKFVKWDDGNTNNPRTITVTSNATYTATFEELENVTFSDPSTLEVGTYGQLTYQLPMPDNQWYWISLPFDVNVDKITVDGATNGVKNSDALVITEYNAEARAAGEQGWTNINSNILEANKGYVMGPTEGAYNANMVVNFPSASTTNNVNSSANNTLTSTGGDAQNANWYIIGTGLYHQGSLSGINYVAMPAKVDGEDNYKYKYISSGNELFTEKIDANSFDPFTAFFVQHGGEYSATATDAQSAALAPVARAKAQEQEQIYLINMNEAHTVVILNAEGSEGYTAGEDFLEMNIGSRIEMIYSFDGTDALAFNHRALEAQTIALGGYVATAGEQTISLNGYNANVESVTLIDNTTGETADLLAGDYTFTAEVGSLDGRFTVIFGAQKAGNTTVDCYNSTTNQLIAYGSANACTVSGLTTGEAVVVYNAMGQLVFATIADSETITLPTLPTGNYLILHNGTTNKTLLK